MEGPINIPKIVCSMTINVMNVDVVGIFESTRQRITILQSRMYRQSQRQNHLDDPGGSRR